MSASTRRTRRQRDAARGQADRGGSQPVKTPSAGARRRSRRHQRRLDARIKAALAVAAAVAVLGVIYALSNASGSGVGARDAYPFEVGNPGPGEVAPPITLAATDGTIFDLSSARGETVLLFFQEGIMCQPCWDQIVDMEASWDEFAALGIDRMVSITTDPLDLLERKVADEGIETPLLSDPDLRFSKPYEANLFGMMGTSMNGHSFVLVDEDGLVRWRADYGGAPKYTMYVPIDRLLADMRAGGVGELRETR